MNMRFLWLGLLTALPAFAVDEYPAVPQGKTQVSIGAYHTRTTGFYDDEGESWDYSDYSEFLGDFEPSLTRGSLQAKFGLAPGLDVETSWSFAATNEDGGDLGGMLPPSFAIKYFPEQQGVGAYAAVTLPIATGDFDNPGLEAAFAAGALMRREGERLRFTGAMTYTTNEDFDIGILGVLVRPELRLKPAFGLFMEGQATLRTDEDARQFALGPGLQAGDFAGGAVIVRSMFTVAGVNSSKGWALIVDCYLPRL